MGAVGGYQISRSLRFRSSASAYLNRTPASASNRKTWTWSGWVKRGTLGAAQSIFSAYDGSGNNDNISFTSANKIELFLVSGGAGTIYRLTTAVYRDPSAWYHIVVSLDTTNATAQNRARIWVNGVEVTAFDTNNTITQNSDTYYNSTNVHNIGRYVSGGYLDGYYAEVNFIDGQALTPSSFGAYDTNGVWQPKKYSGTYGTNGFYLPFNWSTNTSYAGSFNGSTQYLTVPTNTAFDFGSGNFTIEAWVLTDTTTNRNIVAREYNGNGSNYTGYIFSTTQAVASTSGSGWEVNFTWSLPSANQWHHYAFVRNGNVYTVYIDGIAVGTQTVAGTLINGFGSAFTIGYRNGQGLPNGSISNLRVVKGTAVYTSNFTPPSSALTAISGTSLLTLQSSTVIDNSTNAFTITNVGSVAMAASSPFGASILADASGNNNGWFGNNINYSSLGTTYDSMIDSPTNAAGTSTGIGNYATFNPLVKFAPNNSSYSSGNLGVQQTGGASGSHACAMATIAMSSGKWYAEFSDDTATYDGNRFGILNINNLTNYTTSNPYIGWASDGYVIYKNSTNAVKENNGSSTNIGSNWTAGAIISVAVDIDNSKIWWRVNGGSWFGGGDPAAGTSPVFTIASGNTYAFAVSPYNNNGVTANFGQRPFSYTPPSGYKALNTYNLPAPSIANGAQYMAATTWTGDGTSPRTLTNGGNNTLGTTFAPDFVWIKSRSLSIGHTLYDVVRGAGSAKALYSNSTEAEGGTGGSTASSQYGYISTLNSDGFSVSSGSVNNNYVNSNGNTYVGWQWKGGGTAVTNNSGTISSQVSANTSAGFSIITYTAQSSGTGTVGHGLGVAPDLIITKPRANAYGWTSYHSALGNTKYIELNTTSAATTLSTVWNNTNPTSTVFTSGSAFAGNGTYVAYCFAAVRGYSAFGSYTGNGSTDGPFIYTGFRPRFVLTKCSSNSTSSTVWTIWDTSRNTYNASVNELYPNLSNAELVDSSGIDILSNGFKPKRNSEYANLSGWTYIYAAFAENPFNYSRAR